MGDDAYSELVALMRGQSGVADGMSGSAPVRMRLGRVVSTEPLCVEVAGLRQPASALWINAELVKGAAWKVMITSPEATFRALAGAGGPAELPSGTLKSTDATLDKADMQLLEFVLAPGDQVLLFTEDDQTYYIFMRVVKAE